MAKKVRSRCYHLILYEEDITHKNALDYIQNNFNYACILHDKDFDEITGEIKKSHYHVILYFDNAVYLSSLAKQLGIKSNYIWVEELKKGLEYLIHKNNAEKFQYSIDEVFGTLKYKLYTYLNNNIENESQCVKLILSFFQDSSSPISLTDFILYLVNNNLWSYYRRSQTTFLRLLDEHNKALHIVSNVLK